MGSDELRRCEDAELCLPRSSSESLSISSSSFDNCLSLFRRILNSSSYISPSSRSSSSELAKLRSRLTFCEFGMSSDKESLERDLDRCLGTPSLLFISIRDSFLSKSKLYFEEKK